MVQLGCNKIILSHNNLSDTSGVARGQGVAAAPGRRGRGGGGAKILPKIFFNLYIVKFLKI